MKKAKILEKAFLHYMNADNNNSKSPVKIHPRKNNGQIFMSIDVRQLRKGRRVDSSFFSVFGYQVNQPYDDFILPIIYLPKAKIKPYLQIDKQKINKRHLVNDIRKSSVMLEIKQDVLDELSQLWLNELIQNAYQHGDKNVIFCVRRGSWEIRDKFFRPQDIYKAGYQYRYKFLNREPERRFNQYIDIYVVDSGDGFISIKDKYEKDSRIKNSKQKMRGKNKLQVLHRYALFHYTTSKQSTSEENLIYSTGLGLISEQIVKDDAIVSIKDHSSITYFEKQSLERAGDEGTHDFISKTDFGLTSVAVILPIQDDTWTSRYKVHPFNVKQGVTDKLIIINLKESGGILPDTCSLIQNSADKKYKIEENIPLEQIKTINDSPIIIDIPPARIINKALVSEVVTNILEWRKYSMSVFIAGARISIMKMFQSIISAKGQPDYAVRLGFSDSDILCIMLTDDLKLFWCGRLTESDRDKLNEWISDPLKNNSIKELLKRFGHNHNDFLPLKTIDRALNKLHGKKFLEDLIEQRHLIEKPVLDNHGNLLDRYYEVKTFLDNSSTQKNIAPDIRRLIKRYASDLIIVDCPELVKLVRLATDKNFYPPPDIARLQNEVVDTTNTPPKKFKKVIVILSAAFAGATFETIKQLSRQDWNIEAVVVLLDLTNRKTKNIEKEYAFLYDRFAKATPPQKLNISTMEPLYISSAYGRLIPSGMLKRFSTLKFKSAIPTHANFELLRNSKFVSVGHIIGHRHHYDAYLDIKKIIHSRERIYQIYINMIRRKIAEKGFSVLVYPEESDLSGVLSSFRINKGRKPIEIYPARHIFDDTYTWRRQGKPDKPDLRDKKVLVIDESVHTGLTLRGLLKLVKQDEPALIDVVVMQKRISIQLTTGETDEIAGNWLTQAAKNFSCVVDIRSPVWTQESCPYCKAGVQPKTEAPDKLKTFIELKRGIVKTKADFIFWFVGGLYESREKSLRFIKTLLELKSDNRELLIEASYLLIVHADEISQWRLTEESYEIIRKAFSFANTAKKIKLLKYISNAPEIVRQQYIKSIFSQAIIEIDKPEISNAIKQLAENNENMIDIFDNIVNKNNYSQEIISQWQAILKRLNSNLLPDNLHRFFSITKMNRALHHVKLCNEIKNYVSEGSQKTLWYQAIIEKLKVLSNVVINLEKLGFNDDKKLVTALQQNNFQMISGILNDATFTDKIVENFCIKADELITSVCDAVGDNNATSLLKEIYVQKLGAKDEVRLLCLSSWKKKLLLDHLADNKDYGISVLSVEVFDDNQNGCKLPMLILRCTSNNPPTISLKEAKKTSGCLQIKQALEEDGCHFDYEVNDNSKFITRISLQIVDNVSIVSS